MTGDRSVLIIDDNVINAELANAHLRRSGWKTRVVESGADGLAAMAGDRFDLVLLDISMPGMSGMEVCQKIRENRALVDLPVIAYTAHAQPEDRRSFIASGFNDVLIKPVSRDTLANAVAAVMQHHK